jgi:cobyric acid synthase
LHASADFQKDLGLALKLVLIMAPCRCKMNTGKGLFSFRRENMEVYALETIEDDETFEVEYCSWNGWVRK